MPDNSDVPHGFESGDEQPPTLPDYGGTGWSEKGFSRHIEDEERFLPSIPGYDILERIGRGGTGVVYKAWQFRLKRYVALKMLRDGALADAEQRARFRGEAEAVARLRHPNIVQIHDTGEHEGRPYLALEYVEGGSLARRLSLGPLQLVEAVHLVETVARAVHAAHESGVIHRDLTPANILLDADGSPRISDFGLAKRLDRDTTQTYSGAILGTPAYMAPEQAAGQNKRVGVATDVYALGTILYELLTGRLPFRAPSPLETMNLILFEEPPGPRRLDARLPRDLETICLKCLQKETQRRYASALELAEDLRRWKSREPDGHTLASASADRTLHLWRTERWERGPTLEFTDAVAHLAFSHDGRMLVTTQTTGAMILWDSVSGARLHALTGPGSPYESAHVSPDDRNLVLVGRNTLLGVWDISNCQTPRLRHGLWDGNEIVDAAFAPSGLALATAHRDGRITLWDARDWKSRRACGSALGPVRALAFTANGQRLAKVCDTTINWSRQTRQIWPTHNVHVDSCLPGDCGEGLHLWDTVTGERRPILSSQLAIARPSLLATAGDGRTLATAQPDGNIWLWDLVDGKRRAILSTCRQAEMWRLSEEMIFAGIPARPDQMMPIRAVAFAPDSRILAVLTAKGAVQLWDTVRGVRESILPGDHRDATCLAFAPDGNTLATQNQGEVELWDIPTRQCRKIPLHSGARIRCLAFSSDGRWLASGASDCSVKLFDRRAERGYLLSGHTDSVSSLAFAQDGRTLGTGSFDRTVRLWDVATAQEVLRLDGHSGKVHCLSFAPDGCTLASGGETPHSSGEVYLWRASAE